MLPLLGRYSKDHIKIKANIISIKKQGPDKDAQIIESQLHLPIHFINQKNLQNPERQ